MMYLLVLAGIIVFTFIISGVLISAPRYKGPTSDHFDGKRFRNYGNVRAKGLFDVLKWMVTRRRKKWQADNRKPSFQQVARAVTSGMTVTFINHSSFLIQTGGVNILTDPIYSQRASPFQWAGPERMREPGLRFKDLPPIDLVLITHNHYDHLDIPTIRRIESTHAPGYLVPLGVGAHFRIENISRVDEMDWWEKKTITERVSVECVPAQHFSGRGTLDRDKTLWCGYVIHSQAGSVYFAGDTGYSSEIFKKIGMRTGPFDLSIIPIGAYRPEWFMAPIHCTPLEAVKIHMEVNSKQSVASHFGTFPLADESSDDPVNDLRLAVEKFGIPSSQFRALREGESIVITG
jgi:L-ascorbate metabolism protein UlaG (beta-lactamase superfamily)